MTFLTILVVNKILCSFRLVLEGKTGKDIPESSRLEFLEKFLAILLYQMLYELLYQSKPENNCNYCKIIINL